MTKRNYYIEALLETLGILVVLSIAGFLRLYKIQQFPGWYNDEGMITNIATNMLHGQIEYLGIQGSLLIAGRQPLFVWVLSFIFSIFGPGIDTLRSFSAVLGVISTGMLFFIFRKYGKALGLLIAFSYAIFPKAILYSRIGFSYSLIVPLVLLSFWAAEKYLETGERRFAIWMALFLGLSLLSDLVAFTFAPTIVLLVLWKQWKDLFFTLPALSLPLFLYYLIMALTLPEPLIFDINFVLSRLFNNPFPLQFILIFISTSFILHDVIFLFGITGMVLFPDSRLKFLLLGFTLLPTIMITRTIGVGTLGWYYLIPLFPFFAIGVGLLLYRLLQELITMCRHVVEMINKKWNFPVVQKIGRFLLPFTQVYLIFLLFLMPASLDIWILSIHKGGSQTEASLDFILVDVEEAKRVINFLNQNIHSDEITLASPAIAWAINGNVTDYQIFLAYEGNKTIHFPGDIPLDRFRFHPNLENIKYVVIDNIWLNWGEDILPGLSSLRNSLDSSQMVFQTEHIVVYQLID